MMTPFKRLHLVCTLYRSSQIGESSSYLLGNCKSYSSALSNGSEGNFRSFHPYPHLLKSHDGFPFAGVKSLTLRSTMAAELSIFMNDKRMVATQVKPQTHSRQVVKGFFKQQAVFSTLQRDEYLHNIQSTLAFQLADHKKPSSLNNFKVDMLDAQQLTIASPGFIYEPYEPREKIPFWKRWFTRSGWRRTKNDILLELKNAYAIAKLRKKGYSKNQFYNEATNMYKEINTLIANGDKRSLRKAVTEKMFSALKNEIKQRETTWGKVYWEMVEPVVKIRTLRARLIGVDRKDLDKVFIQLTLEILVKQKFEAYDSKGSVVAGDKSKEVLVRDIWVFEKSLFHPGARWLLCGRISPKASQLSP